MTTLASGNATEKDLFNSAFKPTKAWVKIMKADSVFIDQLTPEERENRYRYDKSDFINLGVQILEGQPYAKKYVWRKVKYAKHPSEVNTMYLKEGETAEQVAARFAKSAKNFVNQVWFINGRTGDLTPDNCEQLIGCIFQADLRPKGDSGDAVIFGCMKTPLSEYNKIASTTTASAEIDEDGLPF